MRKTWGKNNIAPEKLIIHRKTKLTRNEIIISTIKTKIYIKRIMDIMLSVTVFDQFSIVEAHIFMRKKTLEFPTKIPQYKTTFSAQVP